jgi:hypothetical protein
MGRRAVTLVLGKSITGILRVELHQRTIARDLGEDRCRCDRCHARIALDHRFAAIMPFRQPVAVDQHVFRLGRELLHGARHREQAGMQDIDAVDLDHGGRRHGMGQCPFTNHLKKVFAFFFRQFF